jgi:hypothetical protein
MKLLLLSLVLLEKHAVAQDENATLNELEAYKECSYNGKEWHICFGEEVWPKYFCPIDDGFNSSQLLDFGYAECFSCPEDGLGCETAVSDVLQFHNLSDAPLFWDGYGESLMYDDSYECDDTYSDLHSKLVSICQQLCEGGKEGDECSVDSACTVGTHFCDYAENSGTCKECPEDINDCSRDGFLTSDFSRIECLGCRLYCKKVADSFVDVGGEKLTNMPIRNTIQPISLSATGTVVDCSNLILNDEDICPGAEGAVCLVQDSSFNALPWVLSQKAEDSGCVAIIKFGRSEAQGSGHANEHLAIPFVDIGNNNGTYIKDQKLGSIARVQVGLLGSACYDPTTWYRNDTICTDQIGCDANQYCDFDYVVEDGEYTQGRCQQCPTKEGKPDPVACFFDTDGGSFVRHQKKVESCSRSCDYHLTFDGCKLCPHDVSGFQFGTEGTEKCKFCPNDDVLYPDRLVPLFGDGISCWQMQAFFEWQEFDKDAENCRLAQTYNYICGCEGSGYGGASSPAKQAALVWLPRVMAVLSLLVSLLVDRNKPQ